LLEGVTHPFYRRSIPSRLPFPLCPRSASKALRLDTPRKFTKKRFRYRMFRTVTDPMTPASKSLLACFKDGTRLLDALYMKHNVSYVSVQLPAAFANSLYVIIDYERRNVVYRWGMEGLWPRLLPNCVLNDFITIYILVSRY